MNNLLAYTWAYFLALTLINVYFLYKRTQLIVEQHPILKKGLQQCLNIILVLGTIPWGLMGIGQLTNMVGSPFDFLYPFSLQPIVLLFHLYLVILFIVLLFWVCVGKGAKFIYIYQPIFKRDISKQENLSHYQIKWITIIVCLIVLLNEIFFWLIDFVVGFRINI